MPLHRFLTKQEATGFCKAKSKYADGVSIIVIQEPVIYKQGRQCGHSNAGEYDVIQSPIIDKYSNQHSRI